MDTPLTQLGVGAIVALMILDKVLPYVARLRNGRPETGAGEKSVEFWQQQYAQSAKLSVDPILVVLDRSFAEIREDHKAIRVHLHGLNQTLQMVATSLAVLSDRRREPRN